MVSTAKEMGVHLLVTLQPQYSLLSRENEWEVIPVRNIHQALTPVTRSNISASLRYAVSGREHLPLHFPGLNDDGHML